jgi:short-subunit dehydrogenase
MKAPISRNAALFGAAIGLGVAAAIWRKRHNLNLTGKVVLITGGSRGLGLALARGFAKEGASLVLCARDQCELEAAQEDLAKWTSDVLIVPCDVSDPDQVNILVEAAIRQHGRIDVLVNNAGVIQVGPFQTMTLEDIFWGSVYTTLAVLPHMLDRREGRIVNITSVGGKVSVPHLLPYSCAKFAVVAFSEGLRAELQGSGVQSITIAPGLMRTGSFLNAYFKGDDEREAAWFSVGASIPGCSISAGSAVNQIIAATKRGKAVKILSLPANLLALFHGIFPGATADIFGLINRALPHGRGVDSRPMGPFVRQGRFLNAITALGQRAARQHLQSDSDRGVPVGTTQESTDESPVFS